MYAPSRAKSLRCHGHGEYNYFDSLWANVIGGIFHYIQSEVKNILEDLINGNGPWDMSFTSVLFLDSFFCAHLGNLLTEIRMANTTKWPLSMRLRCKGEEFQPNKGNSHVHVISGALKSNKVVCFNFATATPGHYFSSACGDCSKVICCIICSCANSPFWASKFPL